jgi:hypothetical protein
VLFLLPNSHQNDNTSLSQLVQLVACIREVLDLNLGCGTILTEVVCGFPVFLHGSNKLVC